MNGVDGPLGSVLSASEKLSASAGVPSLNHQLERSRQDFEELRGMDLR